MVGKAEPTAAEWAASEWIVRLVSLDATEADRREFLDWLSADPANRAAFAEVARTWRLLRKTRTSPWSAPPPERTPWRAPAIRALAVAVLALMAFLVLRSVTVTPAAREMAYATQTGEQKAFALPDGSTMELDAATEARIAFGPIERRVTLGSGAALFDVRRDPRRPFVVCTPHGDVRVLGTSFVVRVRESSASATVFRGVVRGETPALRDRAGVHARVRLVATARANQEITMGGSQLVLTAAPPNIVARRLAWRRGVLDVYNEPLGDAAAEVTRHSGVEFEFADPAFARKGIVAHRPAGDADGFAAHVEEALGLQAERVAPDRIRFSEDPRRER